MRQRLITIWQALRSRAPKPTPRPTADPLDVRTDQQEAELQQRWWYWRYHYLEAKRRTFALRHDQADA